MSKNTFKAFIARGIDTQTAQSLTSNGETLKKLKLKSKQELIDLGILAKIAEEILKEARPPIPDATLTKLLYDTKRTCCICRDSSKSIIVHHIIEWHKSKDHSEENLITLCLQHHDEAHTKKDLSLNLTPKQLKDHKKRWIESVKHQDSMTILGLVNNISRWDYINIKRVFEMLLSMNIPFEDIKSYRMLLSLNVVDNNGILKDISEWNIGNKPSWHLCDFGQGVYLGDYLKNITERIISKLPLIDLTNNMNKGFINSVIKPGTIFTSQLGFYFKEVDSFEHQDGVLEKQFKRAYYKSNLCEIEFLFDASECTSSSGRFNALVGRKVITPILFARSITTEKSTIKISTSCLAIGTWFDDHRKERKL